MHENRLVRISRAVVLAGVSMLIGIAVNAQTAPDNTKSAFQNWLVVGADLGRPRGEASFAPTRAGFETRSKVNRRDRAPSAVTADQQKDNAGDREITRKIRQSLIKDKTLSSYAHNIKVIAQGGQVTLKGPVRSDEEKHSVESKAIEVAGAGHVTNQMSVAPGRAKASKK